MPNPTPTTTIQSNLVSPGLTAGVYDPAEAMFQTHKALLGQYAPGLGPVVRGIHFIAVEEPDRMPVPGVAICPGALTMKSIGNAVFEHWYNFEFYFAVTANSTDACTLLATNALALLMKLYSNNALNDRQGTNPPSNQFAQFYNGGTAGTPNPGGWIDSEIISGDPKKPFLLGRANAPKFCSVGEFLIKFRTVPGLE